MNQFKLKYEITGETESKIEYKKNVINLLKKFEKEKDEIKKVKLGGRLYEEFLVYKNGHMHVHELQNYIIPDFVNMSKFFLEKLKDFLEREQDFNSQEILSMKYSVIKSFLDTRF